MDINNPGMSFEVIYQDAHLIQVEVKASNGRYAGVTTFYSGSDGQELIDFAGKLQGFPQQIGQEIIQEFGFTYEELKNLQKKDPGLKMVSSFVGFKLFLH